MTASPRCEKIEQAIVSHINSQGGRMITLPRMAKVLRKVFEVDAEDLARGMGVVQRKRKLHGTTLALLLVLGWLHHPQAGSSALARFAGTLGVG